LDLVEVLRLLLLDLLFLQLVEQQLLQVMDTNIIFSLQDQIHFQ